MFAQRRHLIGVHSFEGCRGAEEILIEAGVSGGGSWKVHVSHVSQVTNYL